MGFGSYVAAAAEISVTDGNKIKVHRIVAATDPGYAVNPGADRTAGRRLLRLRPDRRCSMAAAPSRTARIEQTNFDTYNSMRINEMPKVETIVMPSGGFWGGVGEPTICVAAPAVLNAYFAATGKRIRSVPLQGSEHHLRLNPTERRPQWPPLVTGSFAYGRAAPDDAEKRRSWHRGVGRRMALSPLRRSRNPRRASS